MNNLNFVSLIGRLTQDNELRTNTNGKSFLSNSIAVQRSFKNANGDYDTDFINVAFSGKTAEFVNEHFHKGDVISVIGNISVTTKETENGKRTFTNVNVDKIFFLIWIFYKCQSLHSRSFIIIWTLNFISSRIKSFWNIKFSS